ncbi:MAG: hypothetical protein JSS81_20105 [Acidobacteria bacterium]|nr:hypothetical protein [Acidobacteriota bacterium]
MGVAPKYVKEIIERAIDAVRTMAPDAKFKGIGLAELLAQAEESFEPRRQIIEVDLQRDQLEVRRDNADVRTLAMIERMIVGVLADDNYGEDSALYEALGFVRKSQRKTGLTRKKRKTEEAGMK